MELCDKLCEGVCDKLCEGCVTSCVRGCVTSCVRVCDKLCEELYDKAASLPSIISPSLESRRKKKAKPDSVQIGPRSSGVNGGSELAAHDVAGDEGSVFRFLAEEVGLCTAKAAKAL